MTAIAVSRVGNRTETESVWIVVFWKMFASTKAVPRLISSFPRHHIPEMLMNSASSVYSTATASASCLLKASSKDASTLRTAGSSFAVLATPGFVIVITSITKPRAIFFMATSEERAYGSADCEHQQGED